MFVAYTTIGSQRGTPRFWIEGQSLASVGIQPGDSYAVEYDLDRKRMTLTLGEGEGRISRRKRGGAEYPIVDRSNRELARLFPEGTRVRVVVKADQIVVTLHHHDEKRERRERRLLTRFEDGKPLKVGSMAHGGGVLSWALHEGLSRAGVRSGLRFAIESESRYLDVAAANNPLWQEGDPTGIIGRMEEVEVPSLPEIDILEAGLPCTGASLSGRAKNHLGAAEQHETAGALFVAFLRVVEHCNPSMIILENVPPYQSTLSMTVIRSALTNLGYTLQETVLNGPEHGAVENRDRLCVVALSEGIAEGFDLDRIEAHHPKAGDRLKDVLEPDEAVEGRWKAYDYLNAKEERDKAAGKGFARQLLTGEEATCGTLGRGYSKARSTEPFIQHPTDGSLSRLLTPTEHARVKTIPERLVAGLGATLAHEVLGQSVIFNAFADLGVALGKHLGRLGAATPRTQRPPASLIAA